MAKVNSAQSKNAKPFLKWAGGKTQLLNTIKSYLPLHIKSSKEVEYVEPFVGSGAMFFWFLKEYPQTKRAVINDINPDLFKAYLIVKKEPENLIKVLSELQTKYYVLKTERERKEFFLAQRQKFNTRILDPLESTSLLIFMNKTCYNGLYRVNRKGTFNVPFGLYKNPKICDTKRILFCSQLLQKATVLNLDYSEILTYVNSPKAFFYIDPPYKPISKSSSFNAYANNVFDDSEQERLKKFCTHIDELGHSWLLSNSDVRNYDTNNDYFDNLYIDFTINRVKAKRNINSNSSKRGEIYELLVSNY